MVIYFTEKEVIGSSPILFPEIESKNRKERFLEEVVGVIKKMGDGCSGKKNWD